jgi:hypothetical protein
VINVKSNIPDEVLEDIVESLGEYTVECRDDLESCARALIASFEERGYVITKEFGAVRMSPFEGEPARELTPDEREAEFLVNLRKIMGK